MGAVYRVAGGLMPPGFYYKTFISPPKAWKTYEEYIRKAAGLGRSPREADADAYDHMNRHTDVLVVGAGPAGLSAALAAARAGARVILVDEQAEMGGSLLSGRETVDGKPAADWVREVLDELEASGKVTLLPRTTANGYHDHNFLTLHERCTDHLGDRAPEAARASACTACAPIGWCSPPAPTNVRWCLPTTTSRAACWPRPYRRTSIAMRSLPAGAWC